MCKDKSDEKEQLQSLSERDRDLLLDALDRQARPVPESVRKAKARYEVLVVSDDERSENGQ